MGGSVEVEGCREREAFKASWSWSWNAKSKSDSVASAAMSSRRCSAARAWRSSESVPTDIFTSLRLCVKTVVRKKLRANELILNYNYPL